MHELLALWAALSPSEQYVLIGFFGILLSLPIGELISVEFYSIVDFFAAYMLMGLVFLSMDNAKPNPIVQSNRNRVALPRYYFSENFLYFTIHAPR